MIPKPFSAEVYLSTENIPQIQLMPAVLLLVSGVLPGNRREILGAKAVNYNDRTFYLNQWRKQVQQISIDNRVIAVKPVAAVVNAIMLNRESSDHYRSVVLAVENDEYFTKVADVICAWVLNGNRDVIERVYHD